MPAIPYHNTDLALYPFTESKSGKHLAEECLPPTLKVGETYQFLKHGHRNYLNTEPITLLEIKQDDVLFSLRAVADIQETNFLIKDGQSYTTGSYRVRELIED